MNLSYAATVTVTPKQNTSPTTRPDITDVQLSPLRQATITNHGIHNPGEHSTTHTDTGTKALYTVTNTDATSKSNFTVTTPPRTDTDSPDEDTPDAPRITVTLPDYYVLTVLREYILTPHMDADALYNTITNLYPQSNSKQAVSKFARCCEPILDPDRYIPIYDKLVSACPPIQYYWDDPSVFIARHGFDLNDSRTHPEKPGAWYTELLDLYNEQPHLNDTTFDTVHRTALLYAYSHTDTPVESLDRVNDRLPGEYWHDSLDFPNIGLVSVLLYDLNERSPARIIASSTPTPVTERDYEATKTTVKNKPDTEQSTGWSQLLPLAASQSNGEFIYVLGNTAFWIAGDVHTNDRDYEHAAMLYDIAADLMRNEGSTDYQLAAQSWAHYTRGVHHKDESRPQQAEPEFLNTLRVWANNTTPSGSVERYSYCGAIERLCQIWVQHLTNGTGDIEHGIEVLGTAADLLPDGDHPPDGLQHERYEEATAFLKAVTAELTARKLTRLHTPDSTAPTKAQIDAQIKTAAKQYITADQHQYATQVVRLADELDTPDADPNNNIDDKHPA